MSVIYPTTYRKYSDPKHIPTGAAAPTLHIYKCPGCSKEINSFVSGAPFCKGCQRYMVTHGLIADSKVQGIMNRKLDYSKPQEVKQPTLDEAWDEGLIARNLFAEVKPIQGSGSLKIRGRTSKKAWQDKVVEINGSWYRLADIGKALTPMI